MITTTRMSLPPRPPDAPRRGSRRRRGLPVLLIAVATALAAAACGSSSGSGSATGAGPTTGPITLTVQNGDGGETALLAGYAKLNKAFEAQHPGVTINFVTKNFTDLVNTAKLQLSGSNPPDLTQVNEGYSSMGELITDHLLLNLNSYAARYGWNTRQSPTLLAMDGRFSADGKTMGSGPLWGMAATGAWVGLFENTKVASSIGISTPPATFAELEHDLAIAKQHHVVPLQYGSTDGGESAWLLATLVTAENSPQQLLDIVDARPGTTMTSPAVLKVANTIKTWADNGYFTPGWSAYSNSDVLSKFIAGQGLFDLNGSWSVPLPGSRSATSKFAMIQFPSATSGAKPAAVATGDLAWSIPAKSRHAALAAEYLNFITSAQSAATWIAAGNVPATTPANLQAAVSQANLTRASAEALSGWQDVLTKGTPVPYVDWSTPTFYTTIQSSVEDLAGGKITPQAFTAQLQADYGPFVKTLR